MGFSKSIIAKALEDKRVVRQRNDALRRELKQKLYRDYPRVKEIDAELSTMGLKVATASFSGNTEKVEEIKQRCQDLYEEKSLLYNVDDYIVPFACSRCEDTGYFEGKYCDCILKAAKLYQYKELSTIMPFKQCNFENFNLDYYPEEGETKISPKLRMEKNLAYCKKFVKNFPTGENLLFIGGVGLGKTHLSVAIANELIEKGYGVFYASVENLITQLQKEKFGRLDSDFSFREAVEDADLLVVDDLGTEFNTQYSRTAIYDIVNSRMLSGKSTIINTNLFMEELGERYTDRIASRFIGNYTPLLFEGNDIRQQKAMESKA